MLNYAQNFHRNNKDKAVNSAYFHLEHTTIKETDVIKHGVVRQYSLIFGVSMTMQTNLHIATTVVDLAVIEQLRDALMDSGYLPDGDASSPTVLLLKTIKIIEQNPNEERLA